MYTSYRFNWINAVITCNLYRMHQSSLQRQVWIWSFGHSLEMQRCKTWTVTYSIFIVCMLYRVILFERSCEISLGSMVNMHAWLVHVRKCIKWWLFYIYLTCTCTCTMYTFLVYWCSETLVWVSAQYTENTKLCCPSYIIIICFMHACSTSNEMSLCHVD